MYFLPPRVVLTSLVFVACSPSSNDAGSDAGVDAPVEAAPACTAPTAGPTTHTGTIAADTTWTADTGPHVLLYDTSITAKLTIEPCATVQIAAGKTITVSSGGSIVAIGSATKPISFGPKDALPWASMRALGGTLSFAYTTLAGGGDPLNINPLFTGTLDIRGDQNLPPQEIFAADHVTVKDSASQGIYIHEGGGFAQASAALVVTGSKGYPIHSWSNVAGTIPSGTYTGNTNDEILLSANAGNEAIRLADVTFHERGVPYHVGYPSSSNLLQVSAGTTKLATLTIEAGVTLRFEKGGRVAIEEFGGPTPATGALVAVGTSAKHIVFTSAATTRAAGDWIGIRFGSIAAPATKLDFVDVEYAGGASGSGSDSCVYTNAALNDGAIRIAFGEPTSVFITNTSIVKSASSGIDRGFRSDTKPDFLPTNTFDVLGCKQTYPRDVSGACPTTVPCP
jgi:hypothetical protein